MHKIDYRTERNAVRGDVHAMYKMALIYECNGIMDNAFGWLSIASYQGYAPAFYESARLYEEAGNAISAEAYYKQGARAAYYTAMFETGLKFEKMQEAQKAFELYKKAAEAGNAPAQVAIAKRLIDSGEEDKIKEAMHYLVEADGNRYVPAHKMLLGLNRSSNQDNEIDPEVLKKMFSELPENEKLPF